MDAIVDKLHIIHGKSPCIQSQESHHQLDAFQFKIHFMNYIKSFGFSSVLSSRRHLEATNQFETYNFNAQPQIEQMKLIRIFKWLLIRRQWGK